MTPKEPIKYWNPYSDKVENESVYGDSSIRLLYETFWGQKISDLASQPFFSKLAGALQDSFLSRHHIQPFIEHFHIQMDEFEKGPFKSFNDFFSRRFLNGKRNFTANQNELPAFAEGRYLGFNKVTPDTLFPVKGNFLSATDLLQNHDKAKPFEGGPVIIARLCPVDYHRFHFPDDGEVIEKWNIEGDLQSVNPIALKYKNEVFITNERQVSLLKTKNFGLLAYIEVGAMFVGKIVQSYKGENFKRGDEKGYFLFGASTVIVLGQPGKFEIDKTFANNSLKGLETFIRLGDKIANLK
jgi:phosphatidylserine decarboxylase